MIEISVAKLSFFDYTITESSDQNDRFLCCGARSLHRNSLWHLKRSGRVLFVWLIFSWKIYGWKGVSCCTCCCLSTFECASRIGNAVLSAGASLCWICSFIISILLNETHLIREVWEIWDSLLLWWYNYCIIDNYFMKTRFVQFAWLACSAFDPSHKQLNCSYWCKVQCLLQ